MKIIIEKDAAQKMCEFPNEDLMRVLAWKIGQAYEYETRYAEDEFLKAAAFLGCNTEPDVELRVYLDTHYTDGPAPNYFWGIYNHGKPIPGQVGGFNSYVKDGEVVYSSNT